MSIRKLLLAGAGALILQSCTTTPPVLTAEDLLAAPYALSKGEAFDVDAFFAALPDWMSVSYASASFDPAIGAMVINDLVFEFPGAPGYRVRAERATIWDGDAAAMASVFNGNADFSEMTPLFDRMTFDHVRSEGMQWDGGAQSLAFSVDKMVMDGVAARSFALTPKEGEAEGVSVIRTIAAIAGSYAYDGVAYSGLSFQMNDNEGAVATVEVDQAFARGYDAGRLDYESATGVRSKTSGGGNDILTEVSDVLTNGEKSDDPQNKILQPDVRKRMREAFKHPLAVLASANGGMSTARDIEFMEVRDIDISGGLSWLARWELPPITETDLLDFGSSTLINDKQSLDGKVFYSLARADISSLDFYWLIPSSFKYKETGSTLNTAVLFDMANAADLQGAAQLAKLHDALAALGLEQVAFDASMGWSWNGETGDAELSADTDIVDFARIAYSARAGGPSLEGWDALVRAGQGRSAAPQLTLAGLHISVTDYQMLDRIFAYAAQQSGGTPEDMRQAAPAMIRMSGMQAAEMNPRIPGYIDAVADFVANGGTLTIDAAPAEPVSLLELQSISQTAPQTLPDALNLTITHTEE